MFSRQKALFVLAAAFGAVASPAEADLIYGNLGSSGTNALDPEVATISSTTWYGVGFHTPTSGGLLYLQSIQLGLSVTSGSSGIRVQVFANGTGHPTGTALASMTNTVSSITPTLFNFTLSTPLHLNNNSTYWVVASDSDGGTSVLWNEPALGIPPSAQNGSGYSTPTPVTIASTDSGANWTDLSASSFASINLFATATGPAAVPEPSTWVAAMLLAGGAGYVRWRKRAKTA